MSVDQEAGSGGLEVVNNGLEVVNNGLEVGSGDLEVGNDGLEAGSDGLEAGSGGLEAGSGGLEAGSDGPEAGSGGLEVGNDGLEADSDGLEAGSGGQEAGSGGLEAGSVGLRAFDDGLEMMTKGQITGLHADNMPEIPDFSTDYDGYARLSPACIEPIFDDAYRCPVSTPTVSRQNTVANLRTPGPFIAFASMNRSLQIPNNISVPKHSKYRNSKTRPVAKAQKKNFDCYFVKKIDRRIHIDAQTHGSTWLSSLCAQPVDEIFGKYKRKSEVVTNPPKQVQRSCNSTPGEKALMSAWSSNASNRGTPSVMSKSTRSGYIGISRKSSKASYIEPNLRVVGFDSDSDRFTNNVGFALVPVPSPMSIDADDVTMTSSRDSPVFQKVFRNPNHHSILPEAYGVPNNTYYEPYKRDKRFPEIRHRKSTLSPTRKRIQPDAKEIVTTSSTYPVKQELEESPMHIVTIGQAFRNSPEPTKTNLSLSRCSYRLPKALSMSLPELHGAE